MPPFRPHLLGIDDGPFRVGSDVDAVVVGVMMEAADLVESVALTRVPVDGVDMTERLARWIDGLRLREGLQGIVLGGITLAGLGIIDVEALARRTGTPVLAVSRRNPAGHRVASALRAAGLVDRIALLERTPTAVRTDRGVWVACAGTTAAQALRLVAASTQKAGVPEPLRLAHLIARAVVSGESRGRV